MPRQELLNEAQTTRCYAKLFHQLIEARFCCFQTLFFSLLCLAQLLILFQKPKVQPGGYHRHLFSLDHQPGVEKLRIYYPLNNASHVNDRLSELEIKRIALAIEQAMVLQD